MNQARILLALLVLVAGGMGTWVYKIHDQLEANKALLNHAEATRSALLARKDRDHQDEMATLRDQHQKEIAALNADFEKKMDALRKEERSKLTQAYQQFSGILDGDRKTLDYINLIEQKVKAGEAISKGEADKLATIVTGLSYLQKQYQKPFQEFHELEGYLEKRAAAAPATQSAKSGFWQRLFSKEAREKDKENERQYYRTEGERQAFVEAQSKFATAYSSAQKKMAAVSIDADKTIAELNAFVEEKRGNTQDMTEFFNQARKALNAHQKILDLEPDISKPVIEGAKQ
jgi:hypothetical protein